MASKYLELNVTKGMQDQYIEIDQKNYRIERVTIFMDWKTMFLRCRFFLN